MMKEPQKYIYQCKVLSVYDGDTIRVSVDLGFGFNWKGEDGKGLRIRLAGINTPELKGSQKEAGLKSRDELKKLLSDGEIILQTIKDEKEKFGRYLGIIWKKEGDTWISINEKMLNEGFAEVYNP